MMCAMIQYLSIEARSVIVGCCPSPMSLYVRYLVKCGLRFQWSCEMSKLLLWSILRGCLRNWSLLIKRQRWEIVRKKVFETTNLDRTRKWPRSLHRDLHSNRQYKRDVTTIQNVNVQMRMTPSSQFDFPSATTKPMVCTKILVNHRSSWSIDRTNRRCTEPGIRS